MCPMLLIFINRLEDLKCWPPNGSFNANADAKIQFYSGWEHTAASLNTAASTLTSQTTFREAYHHTSHKAECPMLPVQRGIILPKLFLIWSIALYLDVVLKSTGYDSAVLETIT
uniref:Uncharacterized protein n=1 Tax=Coccidioides posadasii RMSCC 3488 TaxID=454284 RepID=A0A0J6F3S7_COCPO|nr:hypothetical protein CPAG_00292 [Coccidioides posadasii RMSCC 3488]